MRSLRALVVAGVVASACNRPPPAADRAARPAAPDALDEAKVAPIERTFAARRGRLEDAHLRGAVRGEDGAPIEIYDGFRIGLTPRASI